MASATASLSSERVTYASSGGSALCGAKSYASTVEIPAMSVDFT